jgi:outer membrane receptor protein involved in Fe transport
VFEGSVSTDIGENWAGMMSFAAGMSYRKDDLSQYAVRPSLPYVDYPNPNPSTVGYHDLALPTSYFGSTSVFAYGGIPEVSGKFDVREVFGETLIPLAGPLDLSAAVRFADYSGSGGVLAWKLGFDYRVTDEVRLRFTRSRDVRAATLNERFATTGRGGTLVDRFLGDQQYTIVSTEGANSSVDPENADTVTFGVVWQSQAIEGLSFSTDYYDIRITGAIDLLGNQVIMDQCFNGATQLCSLINRFEPTGSGLPQVRSIYNAYLNISEARTRGFDIETQYRLPMGLHLRALLSNVAEASITNPGAPKLDRAGMNSIAPDWNALLSVGYDHGPFGFVWTQRFLNEGVRNVEWVEGIDVDDNYVPSRSYTNLRAYWRRNALEVYGNVQNMFDEEPPPVVGGSLYSDLGRNYALGVRFDF